jgi:hypothetical protein
MGLIMLDFQWNAMMNSKGYSELAKPMYDQKLWAEEFLGMKPPTLRTVTNIAASIAGKFLPGLEYLDDLLFAGLDISQGYKSIGEVVTSLTVTAATALIPGGIDGVEGLKGALINGGIAFAKSYGISVGSGYLGAINFEEIGTGDWIDRDKLKEANKGWYSVSTVAGAVSAGVSAGVGTALGGLDAADSKFLSGAIKLGTAAAGKTAEYATYATYSLAQGGTLMDAYDKMGGLTINIANLGAIVDMVGSLAARGNNDGQSIFGDGKVLQNLSGIGLLEVNFGRDGVSAAIGMGGINVGGALYEQVKRGIDYAGLKSYAKEEQDSRKAEMAWNTYVHGDWTMENTAMRVAGGKDYLVFTDKDFGVDDEGRVKLGETVSGGRDGKGRTITVTDIGDLDTMSVALGHESYRDGTLANNRRETIAAVIAHTKMAASMRAEDSDFSNSAVGLDLAVYDYARSVGNMGIMARYADSLYDSSGDFWKLTKNGRLIDDGHARVVDENGVEIISLEDLGMSDDSDTIGALAKMFRVDREKAAEIYEANKGSIQLGRGAGIGGDDYANALKYALNGTVNETSAEIFNAIFNGMTTNERAEYLKYEVIIGSAFIGDDKGAVAEKLRDITGLHDKNILEELFYTSTPGNSANDGYKNAVTHDFMDEPLREFLNLNLNGSSEYTMADIADKDVSKIYYWLSVYHLDPKYSDVKKYAYEDGREVIFGFNKLTNKYEQVSNKRYGGTFNYMDKSDANGHYDFDVRPFDDKYGTNFVTTLWDGVTYGITDNAYKIVQSFADTLRRNGHNSPGELMRNMYMYTYNRMERSR